MPGSSWLPEICFHSALVKTSVISDEFRARFLSQPGSEDCFTARAIVFDGPEDYRRRIEDPELDIDETCILVVRGAGPLGFPGSGEVVNMTPPGRLVSRGIPMLPCLGDGRQSGTSDTPLHTECVPGIGRRRESRDSRDGRPDSSRPTESPCGCPAQR